MSMQHISLYNKQETGLDIRVWRTLYRAISMVTTTDLLDGVIELALQGPLL